MLRGPAVRKGLLAGVVALLTIVAPGVEASEAEQKKNRQRSPIEAGVFAGFILPDTDLIGSLDPGIEPTVGLHFGGGVSRRWNWFIQAQAASFAPHPVAGKADMLGVRGGFEALIAPGRRVEPFVSGSWGYTSMEFENATTYFSAFASLGLGQHYQIGARTRLRWEIRIDQSLASEGLRGADLTHPQATIGFNWVSGKSQLDHDRDGVAGHRDRCRDTPAGALVDARGCPRDSDRDGVFDGLDECPATAAGLSVDVYGCALDEDLDGVPDGLDRCAATPVGAVVDRKGCPIDGDKDGVFDGFDECPKTLLGIEVDEKGCFLDRDGDGVYDVLFDRCPDTPKGTKVDEWGCPVKEEDAP